MTQGKDEAPVVKRVMMRASQLGMRLFRNNRGLFYTLDKKRKVRAGLEVPGSSDLIGITSVTITQDMVGEVVGVFTVAEVKKPSWKKPSTETERQQENFIKQIKARGGFGFFINDHEKLEDNIKKCLTSLGEVKYSDNRRK